jgi:chemotaxis protein methyltransferase CheR
MRPITELELSQFQRFIYEQAGITLSAQKKALVMGRLGRRLSHHGLETFSDYFQLLVSGQDTQEVQIAVDLLTTNETYFFREIKHFEFLREQALAARGRSQPFRVWSAASSSGEEAYSIAMVLADCMGNAPWEIVGTDISTRMVQEADRALYTLDRARHVPPEYLRRYCLKGTAEYHGKLLIDRSLRARVKFRYANLNVALPEMGQFDFVFLRNVMIYFSNETKQQVVNRAAHTLKPRGYFLVGHSETLNDVTQAVLPIAPAIYQKPG